jgi:hypothetical protein
LLTFSKVRLRHNVTRALSPAAEQEMSAAATDQNQRSAACDLFRRVGTRHGPGQVRGCIQYPDTRLLWEQDKGPPPPGRSMSVPAPISQLDSIRAKAQPRGWRPRVPDCVIHQSQPDTSPWRRHQAGGSPDLRRHNKHQLVFIEPLRLSGRCFQLLADRLFVPALYGWWSNLAGEWERLRPWDSPHRCCVWDRCPIARAG